MRALAMKQRSHTPSSERLWQEAQARAQQQQEKTGIPFHLWLLHSQKLVPFPSQKTTDPHHDLHRAFRDELLS